ncbi:hypothetical protein NE237_026171 [Protea cynaroides]|uniref:Uncharacterized protein n=1 Tax=Protea cynaroides TaxID=273540 RepID=A0A9Q0K211_9MAGN|nr:hypothetical protein NE237_026171 [Protea cynaroides]
MARALSQTAIRLSSAPSFLSLQTPSFTSSSRFLNHRNRSTNRSEKTQLTEVDVDSDNEVEVLGMRRLEEAIHGIMVRRAAPEWLPFLPGSSYWVPPRKRPSALVELVGKMAYPLTDEELVSHATLRGWPSLAYFAEGASQYQLNRASRARHL